MVKTWIDDPLVLAIAVAAMGALCLWAAREIAHGQARGEAEPDQKDHGEV